MQLPTHLQGAFRLLVLLVFTAVCVLIFGYLWVNSGGRIPWLSSNGYEVSVQIPQASNLVYDSDVMIAGVDVGKVASLKPEAGHADVTMRLSSNAPLHKGATVQVREKTLVQETYLEITDGKGAALPDHATLPAGSGKSDVTLNDVLVSLNPPTRKALGSTITSLGAVTAGNRQAISDALSGLGDTGRQGKTVLSALSAQSGDLQRLTANAAALLSALNGRQADLAKLVSSADALTQASSDTAPQLQQALHSLPGLMRTATTAAGSLRTLGSALQPVAANLDKAAPDLATALRQLPSTTANLRALLPALSTTLDRAPTTLTEIPGFAATTEQLIPGLQVDLSDLNPMLSYIEPYGHDIAAFFTNFGATLDTGDANGKAFRVFVVLNEQSLKDIPIDTNIGILNKKNAYPAAGSGNSPGPYSGTYPRVERAR